MLAGLTLTGAVVALVFLGPLAGAADQPHLGAVRVRAPSGGRRGALLHHPTVVKIDKLDLMLVEKDDSENLSSPTR